MIARLPRIGTAPIRANRSHPLNRDRLVWWLALPRTFGGARWFDLIGANHGSINWKGATLEGWAPTTRPGGFGELRGRISSGTTATNVAFTPIAVTTFSWAAWVKPSADCKGLNSNGSYGNLITEGATRGIWFSSEKLDFYPNTDKRSTTTVTVNAWWHLAVTYDATTGDYVLYLNGLSDASGTASTGITFTLGHFMADGDSGGEPFDGAMDDVGLWSRVLSASEVATLYERSRRGYPGLLVRSGLPLVGTTAGGGSPQSVTVPAASAALVAAAPTATPGAVSATVPAASLVLAAAAPTVTPGAASAVAPATSLALVASAPTATPGAVSVAATKAAVLTLFAVQPTATPGAVTATVPTATLGLVASPPAVSAHVSIAAPAASLALVSAAPTVTPGAVSVSAPTASLVLVAVAPSVAGSSTSVAAGAADLALVAVAPAVLARVAVAVPVATLALVAATPTVTPGAVSVVVGAASLGLVAFAPTVHLVGLTRIPTRYASTSVLFGPDPGRGTSTLVGPDPYRSTSEPA